jgi:hypothetical protein
MPELIASAQASSVPWATSPGPNAGPSPRHTWKYPGPLSDMPRSSVFHMCQWVSTRPGATIIPAASITLAPAGAARPVPTAAIAPLLTSTSAPATSPVPGSMVITWPPRTSSVPLPPAPGTGPLSGLVTKAGHRCGSRRG